MSNRLRGALASFLLLASIAGCSSDPPAPARGAGCTLNSDCSDPLSCIFEKCHSRCAVSSDCLAGERCLKLATGSVCQLVAEQVECTYSSQCPKPLKCAVDSKCRVACITSADCTASSSCVSNVCADNDELVQGDVVHTNVNGWNGVDAVEPDAGPQDGSSDVGVDVSQVDDAPAAETSVADASVADAVSDAATKAEGSTTHLPDGSACVDSGAAGLHPSNLPADLEVPVQDGGGAYSPVYSCQFDTDALTYDSTCVRNGPGMALATAGSPGLAVLFVDSFIIKAGIKLSIAGTRPLIVVSSGPIEINGTIDAAASVSNGWYAGGAPGPASVTRPGICPNESVAGGGRTGGKGTSELDPAVPPAGGAIYGTPELVPLLGGSSGGSAAAFSAVNHGGGALQLTSRVSITIGDNGIVDMGGGTGASGAYGVGGGSGGAILLEAPSVIVKGVVAANGAGGAAYWGEQKSGQPSDQPATGGKLDSAGTARAGNGAAGAIANGGDAQQLAAERRAGGGGGAGRIRINTCDGTVTTTASAVISPAEASGCFSKGTLR
jgi:hypothetical protein